MAESAMAFQEEFDLNALTERTVLFDGNARVAAAVGESSVILLTSPLHPY